MDRQTKNVETYMKKQTNKKNRYYEFTKRYKYKEINIQKIIYIEKHKKYI